MPEFENDSDRLEQFFRKATNKPEVAFSEADWSKLEARLDAADAARAVNPKSPKRTIITAAVVVALLLSSVGIWWGSNVGESAPEREQANVASPVQAPLDQEGSDTKDKDPEAIDRTSVPQSQASIAEKATSPDAVSLHNASPSFTNETSARGEKHTDAQSITPVAQGINEVPTRTPYNSTVAGLADKGSEGHRRINEASQPAIPSNGSAQTTLPLPLNDGKIQNELSFSLTDIAGRNKQRARIELPGAEEADQTGRQTMVEEEHASEKEHVVKPRLSLLLSFAPDFSGTSLGQYASPGKAFGGMIHYHFAHRWSISGGVIKNYKRYTGAGEYYAPPTGYWKYYTNGIVPETIDGECSILEFPVMVQYTVRERGQNRWIVGAGASSYLMQTESYRYHFAQPNPGAKDGWDSRGSSRFMFNMLNLTIGYEHQVLPGLMIGLEPYIKLPLEEIGWSNLRLYSSGASITLRYAVIGRKQTIPVASRSRGPD